jgi:hypothetical protein
MNNIPAALSLNDLLFRILNITDNFAAIMTKISYSGAQT